MISEDLLQALSTDLSKKCLQVPSIDNFNIYKNYNI